MITLQQLHDAEINASISSFYDGAWTVKLGDEMNGFVAQVVVSSEAEALEWLEAKAKELFGWEPAPEDEVAAFVARLKSKPVKTEADLLLIQVIEEGMGK